MRNLDARTQKRHRRSSSYSPPSTLRVVWGKQTEEEHAG
jgi:hypothetical protein